MLECYNLSSSRIVDHSVLIVWKERKEKGHAIHYRKNKSRKKERGDNAILQTLILCFDGKKERKKERGK